MDLRCGSRKHAELYTDAVEFKCSSRFCGASSGTVVIHRFDTRNGALMSTTKFKDPSKNQREREEEK